MSPFDELEQFHTSIADKVNEELGWSGKKLAHVTNFAGLAVASALEVAAMKWCGLHASGFGLDMMSGVIATALNYRVINERAEAPADGEPRYIDLFPYGWATLSAISLMSAGVFARPPTPLAVPWLGLSLESALDASACYFSSSGNGPTKGKLVQRVKDAVGSVKNLFQSPLPEAQAGYDSAMLLSYCRMVV